MNSPETIVNIRFLSFLLAVLLLCTGCHAEVESTILTTGPATEPTESAAPATTVTETTALTEATEPAPETTAPAPVQTEPIPETTVPSEPTEETTAPAEEGARDYVLNNNSKKFHYPTCSSVSQIKPSNRADFQGTRQELIDRGYSPCGRCKP